MTNEVTIDGVKLTRQQVEDALKELNKRDPAVINTTGFPFTNVLLGAHRLRIENRGGGAFKDKGIYLQQPPSGYKWALIGKKEDPTLSLGGDGASILTIVPTSNDPTQD